MDERFPGAGGGGGEVIGTGFPFDVMKMFWNLVVVVVQH